MYVIAKPGPLITGEWYNGFGYFGAVPAWWKAADPSSLVRNARGETWSYGNGAAGHQPSYSTRPSSRRRGAGTPGWRKSSAPFSGAASSACRSTTRPTSAGATATATSTTAPRSGRATSRRSG
ncbi:MAG: hypothetical protein R3A48_25545 [Polyangiales bacterium]